MSDYYRIGRQPIETDDVALFAFGGVRGDPIGASLRIGGRTRVHILVPVGVYDGEQDAFGEFQTAVRRFALRYDFQGVRHGPVDIVWRPAARNHAWRDEAPGEPVDREI